MLQDAREQFGLSALYDSMDSGVLSEALDGVGDLLDESWLSPANRRNTTGLYLQLQIKLEALRYLKKGCRAEDHVQLMGVLEELQSFADSYSAQKVKILAYRLRALFVPIGEIMSDAEPQAARVRDSAWNVMTSNSDEAREVRDLFAQKLSRVSELPDEAPFGEFAFPDVKESLTRRLTAVYDFAARVTADLEAAAANRLLGELLIPVDAEIAAYEYCPVISEREYAYADAVVVCTPFADELELYAWSYCKKQGCGLAIADLSMLNGRDAEAAELLFSAVARAEQCLLLRGIERYRGERDELFQRILSFGRASGKKVFVMDAFGDKRIYNELVRSIRADSGFTLMDVAFVYLRMPEYGELTELFEKKGMLTAKGTREKIKKYLPFMGFVGLNRALDAYALGRDWLETGRRVSETRYADAHKYLSLLPTQSLLLDTDWGEFCKDSAHAEAARPEIDYDSIRDVNPINVKRIVEGDFTVYEKCGLLCRYCLTHGEDISVWQTLPDGELEKRLTLATRLVTRLLGVPLEPLVTVHRVIPGHPDASGTCVGGGKEIRFRRSSLSDLTDTIDTICHECFHAFQHMATHTAFCEWYWRELGVTRGRIKSWLENQNRYFDASKKEFGEDAWAIYRAQVTESEARAFATDCLLDSEIAIEKIKWE